MMIIIISTLRSRYLISVIHLCFTTSNIAVIQRYQSKLLRTITNAPWYVRFKPYPPPRSTRPTSSQGHPGTDCYPSLSSGLASQPPCGTTSTPVKQQATKATMDIWWATLRLHRWTPPSPPPTNDRTLAHRKWCIHVFWLLIMDLKKYIYIYIYIYIFYWEHITVCILRMNHLLLFWEIFVAL